MTRNKTMCLSEQQRRPQRKNTSRAQEEDDDEEEKHLLLLLLLLVVLRPFRRCFSSFRGTDECAGLLVESRQLRKRQVVALMVLLLRKLVIINKYSARTHTDGRTVRDGHRATSQQVDGHEVVHYQRGFRSTIGRRTCSCVIRISLLNSYKITYYQI